MFNKSIKYKMISWLSLISLLIGVFSLCAISSFAESKEARGIYFNYKDGVVKDGEVGDRPGIIGDEEDAEKRVRDYSQSAMSSSVDNGSGASNGIDNGLTNGIDGGLTNGIDGGTSGGIDNRAGDNSISPLPLPEGRSGNSGENNDMMPYSDTADSSDGTTAFWGIMIALAAAAAVILIVALLTPKRSSKGTR